MENRQIRWSSCPTSTGFRVVRRDIDACYRELGIVHANLARLPGRSRLILPPKQNKLFSRSTPQSRTAPERRLQIRTEEMHRSPN